MLRRTWHALYYQGLFHDRVHTWTTVLSSSKPNRYSSGVEFRNDFASVTMFLEASFTNQQSLVIRAISVAIELSKCGCSMKLGPLLHVNTILVSTRGVLLAVEAFCERPGCHEPSIAQLTHMCTQKAMSVLGITIGAAVR